MAKTKTVLLIDGDVFIYQIGLSAERATDWGDDLWTLHADLGECKVSLDTRIANVKRDLAADEVIVALSCPTVGGFRRGICSTYKSNRKAVRKPIVHGALRDYLLENYDTILRPNLEADDILGILATQPTTDRRIIVSIDKDFQCVPCNFYRMLGDNPQVVVVTVDQAARFHALQTLTGDKVDGYSGIPGYGPKTAEKALAGVPTDQLWPTIVKAYAEAGLAEEVALTTARLARILQHQDYDTKTGTVKLWTPNSSNSTSSPSPEKTASPSPSSPKTKAKKLPQSSKTPGSAETSAPAPSETKQTVKAASTSSPSAP